jgi:hypothetical protein
MMVVLRTDDGVDLMRTYVAMDRDAKVQAVQAHVTYEENGAHFAFALKLMPWADIEEIAAWVRSCGDEFIGIADGILEGKRLKPDESQAERHRLAVLIQDERAALRDVVAERDRLRAEIARMRDDQDEQHAEFARARMRLERGGARKDTDR